MKPLFFYGSLRDETLVEIVIGRPLRDGELTLAWVPGYRALRHRDEAYPVLAPEDGGRTEGVLLSPPSDDELHRLTFFEEAEYGLEPITVEGPDGPVEAVYFRGTAKIEATAGPWDFEVWRRNDRDVAIEAARELMDQYGRFPVERIDEIWPGIMIRARQRARAKAEVPRLGGLRTDFGPDDVEITSVDRPHTSFLTVEEISLRHRRFGGGWVGPVDRSVVLWGDAVTVLPWDPATDRVMLIEQFRPGSAARGDRNPWCIEAIAGRIDKDEEAEAVARREAEEEGGVRLGRIERIADYYPTSGLAAEHLTSFIGEADLSGADGRITGLDDEHEDIRTIVLSLDEALAELDTAGVINTSPAVISLLWLARHRDRLGREWTVPGT